MRNENWENTKNLFYEVLELSVDERDPFLAQANVDRKIIEDVRQLLASLENNEKFLEKAAVGEVADLIVGNPEKFEGQEFFGRYRIKSFLGEGGMGRVYLAEDTELGRLAAIKILSPLLSKDKERLRRFINEARAASSLNHPNILTIYEVGRTEDSHFIAAEYIDGETLRQRQNQRAMNLHEILDINIQIASALKVAHRAGIIHRDIKPENIMLRRDGLVKVLDFGLAKLLAENTENNAQPLKLLDKTVTKPGIVLGTVAYMSPEQARGKSLDARTDIWSLGVCLYELLTGVQPFDDETTSDVIAAILTRDPPSVTAAIPIALANIVKKTLQKERADRYSTVEEFSADLSSLLDSLKESKQIVPQTAYKNVAPTADRRKTTEILQLITASFTVFRAYPFKLLAGAIIFTMLAVGGIYFYQTKTVPRISPEAVRWFESGKEAAQNGNFYKARKLLDQAVRADDRFLPAQAKLAEVLMELDYEDKAAQTMLRVTELTPQYSLSKPETDYLRAVLATIRRDYQSAAVIYEEIIPETAEREKTFAYFDLGRAFEKIDDSERAAAAFLETVRRDPQFAAAFLRLGNIYWHNKDEAKALAAFATAADIYAARNDYDGLGELFYQKGNLYNYSDNLPEAEKNLKKSLEIALATSNLPLRIKILFDLGRIGYSSGDTTRSQELIEEALHLSQTENLENVTTNGLIDLGITYYFKGDYEKSAQNLNQALQIARAGNGKRAEARALLSLGNLSLLRVRSAEAVSYIEPALQYYNANNFRQETAQAQLALGSAYDQIGRYAPAIELLENVQVRAKEENDQAMIAHTEAAVGLALIHSERFSEAFERCENSVRINQSLGREQIAAYGLLNKAQALIHLGRFQPAREILRQVFGTAEKSRDRQLIAWIHLLLANAALFEGQHREAVVESKKALKVSNGQVAEVIIAANLAAALARLRDNSLVEAKEFSQAADNSAAEFDNPRLSSSVKLVRSEIFLKDQNPSEALREALQAQEQFAGRQAKNSEWRSLAVAAQASLLLNDSAGAKEYARRSADVFAALENLWGNDNFQSYRNRNDTSFYQSAVNRVLEIK